MRSTTRPRRRDGFAVGISPSPSSRTGQSSGNGHKPGNHDRAHSPREEPWTGSCRLVAGTGRGRTAAFRGDPTWKALAAGIAPTVGDLALVRPGVAVRAVV